MAVTFFLFVHLISFLSACYSPFPLVRLLWIPVSGSVSLCLFSCVEGWSLAFFIPSNCLYLSLLRWSFLCCVFLTMSLPITSLLLSSFLFCLCFTCPSCGKEVWFSVKHFLFQKTFIFFVMIFKVDEWMETSKFSLGSGAQCEDVSCVNLSLFLLFPHLFAMKWWDQMPRS